MPQLLLAYFGKDTTGFLLTLVGVLLILMVAASAVLRNHVDRIDPKLQAWVFWGVAVTVVVGIAALVLRIALAQ